MVAASLRKHREQQDEDAIVVLHGASWGDFQRLLELRGDKSAPRLAYLEGELEIMSPSRSHEGIKSRIGCLVEAFCTFHGIEWTPYGAWTLEKKAALRAVEPDECYVFGDVADPVAPDLAIEVIWTRGGPDKLDIYRHLGVKEVWIWRDGEISVNVLRDQSHEAIAASQVLPGIDVSDLCQLIDRPTASQAVREYQAMLAGSPKKSTGRRKRPRSR
jgi:Uma2 family endonuclease